MRIAFLRIFAWLLPDLELPDPPDPPVPVVGECDICEEQIHLNEEVRSSNDKNPGASPLICMRETCNVDNLPPDGIADKDGYVVLLRDLERWETDAFNHATFGLQAATA